MWSDIPVEEQMGGSHSITDIVRHYLGERGEEVTLTALGKRLFDKTGVGSSSTLSAWSRGEGSPRQMDVKALRSLVRCTHSGYGAEAIRHAFEMAATAPRQAPARAGNSAESAATDHDTLLVVDDVIVARQSDRIVLDVRVRNTGTRSANITRLALRVLKRTRYLTAYVPSASYDVLVDGDYNEIGVAHHVAPDEVDQFLVSVGFAPSEVGHVFVADLLVHFNGDGRTVSQQLTFDSCFE